MDADSSTIRRLADDKLRQALAEGDCLRNQLENENEYLRREVTALQESSVIVDASRALRQAHSNAAQLNLKPFRQQTAES